MQKLKPYTTFFLALLFFIPNFEIPPIIGALLKALLFTQKELGKMPMLFQKTYIGLDLLFVPKSIKQKLAFILSSY